jgi:hypothetical protein
MLHIGRRNERTLDLLTVFHVGGRGASLLPELRNAARHVGHLHGKRRRAETARRPAGHAARQRTERSTSWCPDPAAGSVGSRSACAAVSG